MNLNIKSSDNIGEIANFVANLINDKLQQNLKVIWFVSGGSVVPLEILILKKINRFNICNLIVTLADERFVAVDSVDSNWFKLKEEGFFMDGVKMIPYLMGEDLISTVKNIEKKLKKEIDNSDYKIGIFGIGTDGHTAGILPYTFAVLNNELLCAYDTELYERITITPSTIKMLDEAIVYAVGKTKWPVIEKLIFDDLSINEQPSQVLKKVPLLTIFTDYTKC